MNHVSFSHFARLEGWMGSKNRKEREGGKTRSGSLCLFQEGQFGGREVARW